MNTSNSLTFRLNGRFYTLSRADVEKYAREHTELLGSVRTYYIIVDEKRYPIKALVSGVTGISPTKLFSQQASSILTRIGFDVCSITSHTSADSNALNSGLNSEHNIEHSNDVEQGLSEKMDRIIQLLEQLLERS